MNNRGWIAMFFGLACLILLVGVVSISGTMNNTNNGATPQQINQNLLNTQPKTSNLPTEINKNDILNNTSSPSPSPSESPIINMPDMKNNGNEMPKIEIPNMKQ